MKIVYNIKSAVNFVTPYFVPSHANTYRVAALTTSWVTPIIEAAVINLANQYIFREDDTSEDGHINFISSLTNFILSFGIFSVSFAIRYSLDKYLAASLKNAIKIEHIDKFLDSENKFLIGSEHVITDDELRSLLGVTIGNRVDSFVDSFVPTAISQPADIISTCANLYYITKATNFSVFTYALIFAGVSGTMSFKMDQRLAKYYNEEEKIKSLLHARGAFVENNRDSISMMNATKFEHDFIVKYLNERDQETSILFVNEWGATLIGMLTMNASFCFFDILLPVELVKQFGLSDLKYLNNLVSSLTINVQRFAEVYNRKYPQLESNLEKLELFNEAYDQWQDLFYSKFSQVYNQNGTFVLKDFSVSFSKGEDDKERYILHNTNLELESGKWYRLSGESGSGKTTILKAVMNCWPFASGSITYPALPSEIFCIPQKICVPPGLKLFEIISYPLTTEELLDLNNGAEELAKQLMQELNMDKYIKCLYNNDISWHATLSGGEKQKVAVIGAIVRLPQFLILDEVTSNLDQSSRLKIYQLLKHHLEYITVIYTDHHPIDGTEDFTLEITEECDLILLGDSLDDF